MTARARVARGTPAGGQFQAEARSEPNVSLALAAAPAPLGDGVQPALPGMARMRGPKGGRTLETSVPVRRQRATETLDLLLEWGGHPAPPVDAPDVNAHTGRAVQVDGLIVQAHVEVDVEFYEQPTILVAFDAHAMARGTDPWHTAEFVHVSGGETKVSTARGTLLDTHLGWDWDSDELDTSAGGLARALVDPPGTGAFDRRH